ncbi:hypothetical protein evm_011449 [Chilo suppressalis]|nr:hypothetical protein evm_011449 [Chilo suppressalis]
MGKTHPAIYFSKDHFNIIMSAPHSDNWQGCDRPDICYSSLRLLKQTAGERVRNPHGYPTAGCKVMSDSH